MHHSSYAPAPGDRFTPWTGSLPSEWPLVPLKYVVGINERVLPETTPDDWSFEYIDISGVDSTGAISAAPSQPFGNAPSRARRLLREGDVIVSTVRTYLGAVAHIDARHRDCVASTGFAVLTPGPTVDPRFLFYWMRSALSLDEVSARSKGVSYPAVNASDLGTLPFPQIAIADQRALAAQLDQACAAESDLLRRLEAVEALSFEMLTSAEHEAVTGRHHPGARRDPGLGWATDIPAHWQIRRLTQLARLESGHTPSRNQPEYWVDCTIPWFTLGDIWQVREARRLYISETAELISELGVANSAARVLPTGTVMLSRTASVGFAAIMARPMATTQDFANWVCGPDLYPEFLLYVFRCMREEFRRLMSGTTHKTIYVPDLCGLRIPLPPMEEQRAIASTLLAHHDRHERTVAAVRAHADRTIEYTRAVVAQAFAGTASIVTTSAHA